MAGKIKRRVRKTSQFPSDPHESARVAGLRYIRAEGPGIVRRRTGRGFSYIGFEGAPVRDSKILQRIRSLVIPPAWTSVWICPSPNGHLQAVGRDARGRKQYRYHPLYRAVRDQNKFGRMAAFGEALPGIRKHVAVDLEASGMPKRKVLATIVRLLDATCIRIGNEEYAKTNGSFGITTMHEDHVEVSGYTLRFQFRGKSGLEHDVTLTDRRLAKIVRECQCIPGEELFHYLDENGEVCRMCSEDVNDYLREITGDNFTAKDFRTWAGSGQAALELETLGPAASETEAKKNIVAAVKTVARKLGNKPSTCRKYYVHPLVLERYTDNTLFESMPKSAAGESAQGLRREEVCLLKLSRAEYEATVARPLLAA